MCPLWETRTEAFLDQKVTQDLKEILVFQVFQVLQVIQVLRVQKDKKETKVITAWTVYLESGVGRVRLVRGVSLDLQELDLRETEVPLEILDLWVWLDLKVKLDLLGLLGQQVNLVLRVSVVRQDYLGSKGTGVCQDFRGKKVNLEKEVSGVYKVRLVYLDHLDRLEREDPKDQWDWLDMMAPEELKVIKDLQGYKDSEVLLGLQGITDSQVNQGFKGLQEFQGIQDDLVPKVKLVKQEESSMQLDPLLLASQDHQGLLVLPDLLDLQDYQVPLALLVYLANLVLKVTKE